MPTRLIEIIKNIKNYLQSGLTMHSILVAYSIMSFSLLTACNFSSNKGEKGRIGLAEEHVNDSDKYEKIKEIIKELNSITPTDFLGYQKVKSVVFDEEKRLVTIEFRKVSVPDSKFFGEDQKKGAFEYIISIILLFRDLINTGEQLRPEDGNPKLYNALGDLLKEIENVGGVSMAFDIFTDDYSKSIICFFSAEDTQNAIMNWRQNNPFANNTKERELDNDNDLFICDTLEYVEEVDTASIIDEIAIDTLY